jgi:hypothetical protein
MKRKRWLGYLVIIISLIAISGWWLLTYTPPPTATIGYFGENKFLCV